MTLAGFSHVEDPERESEHIDGVADQLYQEDRAREAT